MSEPIKESGSVNDGSGTNLISKLFSYNIFTILLFILYMLKCILEAKFEQFLLLFIYL